MRKLSILEGIFSVVIFTDGNEHCNYIEDTGVESVKGMSMFDSLLVILKFRRLSTRAVDQGLEASPRTSQQLPAREN